MAWLLLLLSAASFCGVTWFAWAGRLGLTALGLLVVATVTFFAGRRGIGADARKKVDLVAKIAFTIGGSLALLRHPIEIGDTGQKEPVVSALVDYIGQVDATTFVTFALIATLVKLVGVVSSAYAWHLLLRGQGIEAPFWRFTMTGFLIGRFVGTFLPSTLGLDGYTLYEASRYSNQGARAVTAKALEKFIGITGLFLGMFLTLPFGWSVIEQVTASIGHPEKAMLLAVAIGAVSGGISAVVLVALAWPGLLVGAIGLLTRLATKIGGAGAVVRKVTGVLERLTTAVGAYRGQLPLLLLTVLMKFVTHFTTFAVYYFTGLAIGVTTMAFWPVVFGSSIQVLATLLSPTIAGEGAREAFQALLLSNQYGGVAQAVLAGALGFIAAEAATLWGGVFLFTRGPTWRPPYLRIDGVQVDYAWLDEASPGDPPSRTTGAA